MHTAGERLSQNILFTRGNNNNNNDDDGGGGEPERRKRRDSDGVTRADGTASPLRCQSVFKFRHASSLRDGGCCPGAHTSRVCTMMHDDDDDDDDGDDGGGDGDGGGGGGSRLR